MVSVGAISASDSDDSIVHDSQDEFSDFDDDEDWDDGSDSDDFDDDEDWDYEFDDYEFLECKIISYLSKFGNCTDENWTQSDDFLNEYQVFLLNSSNYTLNESLKGYQTYLKIFDSITSTFDEYNLTENQTAYLKFMIIYYLNHYGNVSENYTWNESDEFSQFFPFLASGFYFGFATSSETPQVVHKYSNLNNIFNPLLSFSDIDNVTFNIDNVTSNGNASNFNISGEDNSGWANIIVLILVLLMVLLVFI